MLLGSGTIKKKMPLSYALGMNKYDSIFHRVCKQEMVEMKYDVTSIVLIIHKQWNVGNIRICVKRSITSYSCKIKFISRISSCTWLSMHTVLAIAYCLVYLNVNNWKHTLICGKQQILPGDALFSITVFYQMKFAECWSEQSLGVNTSSR